jgi:hypothetical protein
MADARVGADAVRMWRYLDGMDEGSSLGMCFEDICLCHGLAFPTGRNI